MLIKINSALNESKNELPTNIVSEVLDQELYYDDDLKFILLGDLNVGKTSFFKRYFRNEFFYKNILTIGLERGIRNVKVANNSYVMKIYDGAGIDRWKHLTKTFFPIFDGVFLLFDVTNELSFNDVSHWMEELKEKYNYSKYIVYLIGNKIDEPNRVIQRETAETLAKSLGIKYFEVSCKINMNIPEVIARMIMECSVGNNYIFFNDFKNVKNYGIFNKFILPLIKVGTEINSKVNELYSNTLVTQKIINESETPIELKIYLIIKKFKQK